MSALSTCPAGHESTATDYCDVCGLLLEVTEIPTGAAEPVEVPCPQCGEPQTGRFCEGCSYDFVAGVPAATVAMSAPTVLATPVPVLAQTTWTATVSADRSYFDTMRSPDDDVEFPAQCPDRVYVLNGTQQRVGRHSASQRIEPEIDLAGPPQDPGISHLHALLLPHPETGWAVLDLGSTNGTRLNDAVDPITRGVAVPVRSGDRIHLGAWTTLTVHQEPGITS